MTTRAPIDTDTIHVLIWLCGCSECDIEGVGVDVVDVEILGLIEIVPVVVGVIEIVTVVVGVIDGVCEAVSTWLATPRIVTPHAEIIGPPSGISKERIFESPFTKIIFCKSPLINAESVPVSQSPV